MKRAKCLYSDQKGLVSSFKDRQYSDVIYKHKKDFPMLRNMILISLSAFTLAACQTAETKEEHKAITSAYPHSTSCYEKAVNDTFLYMCLQDLLDGAEETMEDMNSELIAKARSRNEEEFERRAAVKEITNSNLAFMTYRQAECTRQATLGDTRQIKDDIFMACKLDLTNERLENLEMMQQ